MLREFKKEFLLECSDKSEQIMVNTGQVILPWLTEVRFVILNNITSSFYSNTAFDNKDKQYTSVSYLRHPNEYTLIFIYPERGLIIYQHWKRERELCRK